jgi:predicted DCC family thiol-disulfide oxidoreductase YuxK
MEHDQHAIVIFDGECVFCNRWVDFLLRFDRRDIFRFAARQSESGGSSLRQVGLPESGVGSIVLVECGAILQRSAAVIRMLRLLGFPFSLATAFRLIPRALRLHLRLVCPKSSKVVRTAQSVSPPCADRTSPIPLSIDSLQSLQTYIHTALLTP